MRTSYWWTRLEHRPPLVVPRNVYDLEGTLAGKAVFLVAPGPSLSEFPKGELLRRTTIGVNAVPEYFPPTYWNFQEKYFCRAYLNLYREGPVKRIITTLARSFMAKIMPEGSELYTYDYHLLDLKDHWDPKLQPPWRSPGDRFLPGRSSITSNALSLAVLTGAKLVVLVGVDFSVPEGRYYVPEVTINRGPKDRERSLKAGLSFFGWGISRGVWRGPRIVSTSPHRKVPGIEHLSVGEALEAADACE
jgi:hypothetical protein